VFYAWDYCVCGLCPLSVILTRTHHLRNWLYFHPQVKRHECTSSDDSVKWRNNLSNWTMHERFEVVSGVAGGWILLGCDTVLLGVWFSFLEALWFLHLHCQTVHGEWLLHPEDEGTMIIQDVGNYSHNDTASHPWRHIHYTVTSFKLGWKEVKFHSIYDTDCGVGPEIQLF
jgi:hypothetical protein